MTAMKRVLSFLLLFLMVLPLLVLPAGAASTRMTPSEYDKTTVAEDLNTAMIGNKKFDVADYPYDTSKVIDVYDMQQEKTVSKPQMEILTLQEIAPESTPALYLYVYNPTNTAVSKDDRRHTVTISINDSKLTTYSMRLLDCAGVGEQGQLYLKFRVDIPVDPFKELIDGSDKRTYSISEFELYCGGANATAFKVGGTWEYADDSANASFVKNFAVLDLDIGTCVWRTDNHSKGDGYKTQVDSVYFAIPNDILAAYDNKIAGITYQAYEYDTGYMLVCTNDKWGTRLYETMVNKEGVKVENDESLPTLNSRRTYIPNAISAFGGRFRAVFVYNDRGFVDDSTVSTDVLSLVLNAETTNNEPNIIIETDVRDRLSKAWDAYNNGGKQTVFSGNKSDHKIEKTVRPDDPLSVDTGATDVKLNWLKLFLTSRWVTEGVQQIENYNPIQSVQKSDLDDIEKNLLVDSFYKDDLASACDRAGEDNTLFLVHFATSDYFGIAIESNSKGILDSAPTIYGDPGFVAKETVYMDFDVISLDFEKDGEIVTIPVASSPVHAIGDLEYMKGSGFDTVPKWVYIVIAVIILVVIVILCPSIIPIVIQILLLPIRLLWWLLKAIGKGFAALFHKRE